MVVVACSPAVVAHWEAEASAPAVGVCRLAEPHSSQTESTVQAAVAAQATQRTGEKSTMCQDRSAPPAQRVRMQTVLMAHWAPTVSALSLLLAGRCTVAGRVVFPSLRLSSLSLVRHDPSERLSRTGIDARPDAQCSRTNGAAVWQANTATGSDVA